MPRLNGSSAMQSDVTIQGRKSRRVWQELALRCRDTLKGFEIQDGSDLQENSTAVKVALPLDGRFHTVTSEWLMRQ